MTCMEREGCITVAQGGTSRIFVLVFMIFNTAPGLTEKLMELGCIPYGVCWTYENIDSSLIHTVRMIFL